MLGRLLQTCLYEYCFLIHCSVNGSDGEKNEGQEDQPVPWATIQLDGFYKFLLWASQRCNTAGPVTPIPQARKPGQERLDTGSLGHGGARLWNLTTSFHIRTGDVACLIYPRPWVYILIPQTTTNKTKSISEICYGKQTNKQTNIDSTGNVGIQV